MTDVATRNNCNFVAQAIQDDGFSTSCMNWYAVLLSQKGLLALPPSCRDHCCWSGAGVDGGVDWVYSVGAGTYSRPLNLLEDPHQEAPPKVELQHSV